MAELLAEVTSSTNRSCYAELNLAEEYSPDVFVPGGFLVDISIRDGGSWAGTVKIQRLITGSTYEFLTDSDGTDYAWTTEATPVLRLGQTAKVRLYCSARAAGEADVRLNVGNYG